MGPLLAACYLLLTLSRAAAAAVRQFGSQVGKWRSSSPVRIQCPRDPANEPTQTDELDHVSWHWLLRRGSQVEPSGVARKGRKIIISASDSRSVCRSVSWSVGARLVALLVITGVGRLSCTDTALNTFSCEYQVPAAAATTTTAMPRQTRGGARNELLAPTANNSQPAAAAAAATAAQFPILPTSGR